MSPAEWSGYDRLMYIDVDAGVLQALNADGSPGPSIPFDSYSSGCDVLWLSESEFIHNGCYQGGSLTHGTIVDGTIVTSELAPDGLVNLALSPNGVCMLQWDRSAIRVGTARSETFSVHPLSTLGGEISGVEISPDNSSVVWTENGNSIYRMELSGCTPGGEPALVREAAGEIRQAVFASPPQP